MVAVASCSTLVVVIPTMPVATTQLSVCHGALQGAAIHAGHGHRVAAVLGLICVRGHRVQLVGAGHVNCELTLLGVPAVVTKRSNGETSGGVFVVQQRNFS